ncbi:MAG: glycosyl transferase [Deltaproteobacteria bacterium]|nr:glycosyl transferase [Deltaproteobacteria bacterium]MBW2446021.1 glycosyl transferase [Deltaproteobacteria bacterium]
MADFHQTGVITTLHRLGNQPLELLEKQILAHAEARPIALVLPCLYQELEGPALGGILEALADVHYLKQVVVSVSGTESRDDFDRFRRAFDEVRTLDDRPATFVWNGSPRVQRIYSKLRDEGLDAGEDGKGRGTWLAYGYVLAADQSRVLAVHDCDIRDYDRELLARLCFPTVNPNLNYEFAKGYYGRVSDRLHGRVTRLFMTPLLRAMKSVLGEIPLLAYLDSFRYPLAGECSMTTDLARINRIPADWGLEVGMLAEVYRNCSLKRICQVEVVENYDHKHQELSEADSTRGLHRMVNDIASSLIRNLASYGVQFDAGFLNTLISAYVRTAQDAVARYSDDAALNGLVFDRHEEEVAVETFSRALRAAGLSFVRDPMGAPLIPNWNRVTSALPDLLAELQEAVEDDLQEGA